MHRCIFLVLLASCAHSTFTPLQMAALPGAERYPLDYAVNLIESQTIRFKRDPKTLEAIVEVESHSQTRLLKGAELEPRTVSYSRTFSKISRLEGRVVLPDGTSRAADPSQTVDRTLFTSQALFVDERVLALKLIEVPIGGVRELRHVETYNDVRPWLFSFTFGSNEPTELARMTIEVPVEWEIDLVVEGQVVRREESGPGLKRIILEATQIPGYRKEAAGPDFRRMLPRAWVRLKTWDSANGRQAAWASERELSAWLDVRYRALGDHSEALKATAAQVLKQVGDNATDTDKARALYEHVAQSVEYCAVEVGYGGWIPHSPAVVHNAQYGDCKDKANYLRALLLQAGISSHVALVHSHTGFPNRFVLPSLTGTFNHAILAVKLAEGVVFADPTERTIPFGLLPARDCESPALLISKEGEKLTVTPSFGAERNTESQEFILTIDQEGRGNGTFVILATGVNAAELSHDLLRGNGKKEALLEQWLSLNQLTVTSVAKVEAAPFADKAVVTGQLKSGQLISRTGGSASLIRLPAFAPAWFPSLPDVPRVSAFGYRWRDSVTGKFEIVLPPGARATSVPSAVVLDTPFFHYQLNWTISAGTVRVYRHLVRKQRIIEQPYFEEFRAAVHQVHVAEARAAVIRFDGQGQL